MKIERCEKCGCKLVPVDSAVHRKMFECIRHLNTPNRCPGTTLHNAPREILPITPRTGEVS